jgi:hypothetical protein
LSFVLWVSLLQRTLSLNQGWMIEFCASRVLITKDLEAEAELDD